MKFKLFISFMFISLGIFSQNNLGLEYSFNVELTNKAYAEALKNDPRFKFSDSFKVFYIEKGFLRYIEKSNNFIHSTIFNNKKSELTLFDKSEIVSKKTGDYNKPEIKSKNVDVKNVITYNTKTGIYNYYYDTEKLNFNSVNLDNLGEHCMNNFIKETGVLPRKIVFEFGFMKFIVELKRTLELSSEDVNFLNTIIEKPNNKTIKKFIIMSNEK